MKGLKLSDKQRLISHCLKNKLRHVFWFFSLSKLLFFYRINGNNKIISLSSIKKNLTILNSNKIHLSLPPSYLKMKINH